MNLFKNSRFFVLAALFAGLAAGLVVGCKKDKYTDTSFVAAASSAGKTGAMFTITQDNTGLVTITPNGEGATTYDIKLGDTTRNPVTVAAGYNLKHVYAEGTYQVTITGHDLKGGTSSSTQPLTVSYIKPQNLKVTVSTASLKVSVSATAQYATFFKIYYGDADNITPIPYDQSLGGQTVTHTYTSAGTYTVKVVALSGGAETTEYTQVIHVSNPIDLPVTFEDANTDYTMSDFGGNASVLSTDPANSANHVMRSTKTAGAQTWAGTTIGGALGFATPLTFTVTSAKMSVMVYSPAVGLDIKLKVEDHNDGTHSVETDVLTTKAGQWETLTFDFTHNASGTPALNTTYNYDKASIFFDFNNPGTGSVFYFDNVMSLSVPLTQIDLPVNFESTSVDYTVSDFGGNASSLTVDPTNSSNHVMLSTKTNGAQTWAGTTLGTASGFKTIIPQTATAAKMTVRIYSPAAGLDIKLKLEEHGNGANSVETDVLTTKAGQWETLTFDFSHNASGTPAWNQAYKYDKCSAFFDFGNAGTGSVFYWDDITLL
ncbi:MAG TPA: PKD domain-containing protein [Puia sp.]|nr:PKD domain-containing protein [Puia sp.]